MSRGVVVGLGAGAVDSEEEVVEVLVEAMAMVQVMGVLLAASYPAVSSEAVASASSAPPFAKN